MSTITKIFIVLVVLFSITFTMMTMQFVARTENWRRLADDYRNAAQVAETHNRNLTAVKVAEMRVANDTIKGLNDQLQDKERQLAEAERELGAKALEVAQLSARNSSLMANNTKLTNELDLQQKAWMAARDQRSELEHSRIELDRRNLDLNERVNELTAQIIVMTQEGRNCEQQLNMLRDENNRLRGQVDQVRKGQPLASVTAAGDNVRALAPPARSAIRGQVVQVAGNIASISVGSADGVAEGMVFMIYRGPNYLAELKITDVEPNLAAGTLQSINGTVQKGDRVTDEARLGFAE